MKESIISSILKQHRNDLHLSISQVTAKLRDRGFNISDKALYSYESGIAVPRVNTFLALCDIYEIGDIMSEFGYTQHVCSGSCDWDHSLYNDFFNAPLLDKIYILIRNGVPSFEGYETQLNACFPPSADAANFNRLYTTFSKLDEHGQGYLLLRAEELLAEQETKDNAPVRFQIAASGAGGRYEIPLTKEEIAAAKEIAENIDD